MVLRSFKIISLVLFFFNLNVITAQDQSGIDSLLNVLHHANDTNYIKLCIKISDRYIEAKKIKLSFDYADSALIKAKSINKPAFEAKAYSHFGGLYNYINDANKAIDNFNAALVIYKKSGFISGQVSVYINKGNAYYFCNEEAKAEKFYRKALQLFKTKPSNRGTEADIYNNLGSACSSQGKHEEALVWFTKSLEICKEDKDSISMAYGYNNIGSTYSAQQRYKEGLPYLQKALELKLKHGDNAEKSDGYVNLSTIYYSMEDYKTSVSCLKMALKYIDTAVYNSDLKKLYESYADNYENLNNQKEANKYYKLLRHMNTTLFNREMAEKIEQKELMSDFSNAHLKDSLMQAARIEKQKIEINRSNTFRSFLLVIVACIVVFLLILYKRYRISQAQKEEIYQQKILVDEKQKEIMDSIKYARRIQNSLMPTEKYIDRIFNKVKNSRS
ncbi:MAG: tetratricopeptide repeat protein [Bacteroidetes bacterium]|nr:tetratricopeptide repeat protein [Bacteroidota bacterium]